jgi:hypothetical protein
MGIPLEEERAPGLPVVKRQALGERFYGAVVKVNQRDRQKKDDATGQMVAVRKADGKARQELVITAMTLPGTTANVGLGEDEHVPEPEELVRLILRGKAFGDWIESKTELGRPINVGDIVTQITDRAQVYDAQGNPTGNEITDQATLNTVPRGRSVGIYGPVKVTAPKDNAESQAWVEKAEKAYYSLRDAVPAEDRAPQEDPYVAAAADPWAGVPPPDDEPPF